MGWADKVRARIHNIAKTKFLDNKNHAEHKPMKLKSNVFADIWLIVAVVAANFRDIPSFLQSHQWFCAGGGHILFKAASVVDDPLANIIAAAGCTLLQVKDSGIYDAWNQAMDRLESTTLTNDCYVAFLGIDDTIREDYCLAATRIAQPPTQPDFIYGDALNVSHGRAKYQVSPLMPKLFGKNNYLFDVPHPGLLNRWETIKKFRFDARYQLAGDFDFYIRIASSMDVTYAKMPKVQAIIGADGMSNSLKALEIYPREWAMIASSHQVTLAVPRFKIALVRAIATVPPLFNLLRRLSWLIRGNNLKQ